MRGITLWQPFASAIFTPIRSNPERMIKRDETRSWTYPDAMKGERIFVHAAKKVVSAADLTPELEAEALLQFGGPFREVLPFGVILGTVVLGECRPTEEARPEYLTRMFGDYRPNRWAWELLDVKALPEPIQAKGAQGWWRTDALDS